MIGPSEPTLPHGDGCTGWFDGSWVACCDIHDQVGGQIYDVLTWWKEAYNLGVCVAHTSGGPLMGTIMFIGVSTGGLFVLAARIIKEKRLKK